jgi:hypothetical protein
LRHARRSAAEREERRCEATSRRSNRRREQGSSPAGFTFFAFSPPAAPAPPTSPLPRQMGTSADFARRTRNLRRGRSHGVGQSRTGTVEMAAAESDLMLEDDNVPRFAEPPQPGFGTAAFQAELARLEIASAERRPFCARDACWSANEATRSSPRADGCEGNSACFENSVAVCPKRAFFAPGRALGPQTKRSVAIRRGETDRMF